MPNCTILIGIPGVGKSTWLRRNPSPTAQIICPDQYLEQVYAYEWTVERASEAWAVSYQQFALCLQQRKDVMWDATFLRPIDRSPIVNIAKGFSYDVRAIFVQAPLAICLERNRERERPPVPDDKIRAMFEILVGPKKSEGFDSILEIDSRRGGS